MIEDLAKKWEVSECVDEISMGDEYIRKMGDSKFMVAIANGDLGPREMSESRLIKRRDPKVPDDLMAIMAEIKDMPYLERRVFIRVDPGDEIWYTSEEDGYSLSDLDQIRAMAEVGEYL